MAVHGNKKAGNYLPYTLLKDDHPSKAYASWLREKFTALLKKRLPTVYYSGFKHSFVTQFIAQYKKNYPFVICLDIAKFYPSISHHQLIVQTQLAYKHLLGLDYVPSSFKKEFLPQAHFYLDRLPLEDQGLPLSSSVSKAWAPLLYVPLLLELKRKFSVKFIVFVDDFWLMCPDSHTMEEVYAYVHNGLRSLALSINHQKVCSGRLGSKEFFYLGYRFAGGYVSIEESRVTAFRDRITHYLKTHKKKPLRSIIKGINHKIRGFGHYYKYAQAKKHYEQLDTFITKTIYSLYLKNPYYIPHGAYRKYLYENGLASLSSIIRTNTKRTSAKSQPTPHKYQKEPAQTLGLHPSDYQHYFEKLIEQNKQTLGLLKDIRNALQSAPQYGYF